MTNWKPKTLRNKKYLQFIREQKCCVPQCPIIGCDPHHVKTKGKSGMGIKGSDIRTVPLCRKHHSEGDNIGMSWRQFQEKYNIDFKEIMLDLMEKHIDEN